MRIINYKFVSHLTNCYIAGDDGGDDDDDDDGVGGEVGEGAGGSNSSLKKILV